MPINVFARATVIPELASNALALGHTGAFTVVLFFTITPLFHTNFAPDLMHVNFLPETVDVAFSFEHFDPALTTA
jgi:hypothetical protein